VRVAEQGPATEDPETLPIGNVDEKVQLRAGQHALPVQCGGTPQLTKTLDNAGQPTAVKTVENRLGPFLHPPTRPLPTLPKRVLFEDGGAYAAAELEAAQPSGTAD